MLLQISVAYAAKGSRGILLPQGLPSRETGLFALHSRDVFRACPMRVPAGLMRGPISGMYIFMRSHVPGYLDCPEASADSAKHSSAGRLHLPNGESLLSPPLRNRVPFFIQPGGLCPGWRVKRPARPQLYAG